MFKILFRLINIALTIINYGVLAYCVLSYLAPNSRAFQFLAKYVDIILKPFRSFIQTVFPRMAQQRFDYSPILLWLAIRIVRWLLSAL